MTTPRRSVNIHDYPEHLNPFFEDDNHTKLRFWANTKRKTRSNSFNFSSIKDFKQSLFSRPTLRKRSGTSSSSLSQLSCYRTHEINDETPQNVEFSRSDEKRKSFILYPTLRKLGRSFSIRSKSKKTRDASADRQTPPTPENEATYYSYSRSDVSNRQTMPAETTYREPVTPLPRSRFHERLRSTEVEKNHENNDDTNPFKDEDDDVKLRVPVQVTPSTSKPTTPPRKKKRAPPPPPMRQSSLTRKSLSAEFSLCGREHEDNTTTNETNHKDIENTHEKVENEKCEIEVQVEIPKIVVSTENIESEINDPEIATTSEKNEEKIKENIDENVEVNVEETTQEPFELNYNSELNISSSQISINSETKLEEKHQQNAVEDSSDLLELVQKLQLEVEKLTDDTNNNVIASTFDSSKKANLYGYDYDNTMNTSSVTTEINTSQHIQDVQDVQDDDNDVVIGAPLSPRFVRLRKDNEWIKH